jgi:hypothetical protein
VWGEQKREKELLSLGGGIRKKAISSFCWCLVLFMSLRMQYSMPGFRLQGISQIVKTNQIIDYQQLKSIRNILVALL